MNIFDQKSDLIIPIVIILLMIFMLYNNYKSEVKDKNDSTRLGVQELIEKIRSELVEAGRKRVEADQDALFEIKEFDLELNFVVKENSKNKGEFEFKAVTVGGESEFSSEKIQKIKLHMTAVPPEEHTTAASSNQPKMLESPPEPETPSKEKKKR